LLLSRVESATKSGLLQIASNKIKKT